MVLVVDVESVDISLLHHFFVQAVRLVHPVLSRSSSQRCDFGFVFLTGFQRTLVVVDKIFLHNTVVERARAQELSFF